MVKDLVTPRIKHPRGHQRALHPSPPRVGANVDLGTPMLRVSEILLYTPTAFQGCYRLSSQPRLRWPGKEGPISMEKSKVRRAASPEYGGYNSGLVPHPLDLLLFCSLFYCCKQWRMRDRREIEIRRFHLMSVIRRFM